MHSMDVYYLRIIPFLIRKAEYLYEYTCTNIYALRVCVYIIFESTSDQCRLHRAENKINTKSTASRQLPYNNNNTYDNLYGAVTRPYIPTRAPHKQLTRVSLSEQMSFKLGFKRVH